MTLAAQKLALTLAISFLNVTTTVAALARVDGINQDNRNTSNLGFVGHKRSELPETPVHSFGPVILTFNPGPRVYVGKVFQRYSSLRAFCQDNQFFRDSVVYIFLKVSLTTVKLFQPPFSTLGSDRLERGSTVTVPESVVFYFFRSHPFTVARDHDILNSKVYTYYPIWNKCFGILYITTTKQEPFTFTINQIRFPLLKLQEFGLSFSTRVRHLGSSKPQDPDRNFLPFLKERQDSGIVSQRAVFFEGSLFFLIQLVGVCYFSDTPNRNLGAKSEFFSDSFVNSFVQRELTEQFLVPSYFTNLVASNVNPFQREL